MFLKNLQYENFKEGDVPLVKIYSRSFSHQ